MSRILIAGCGYVGAELAGRLVRNGHKVWGMRRNPATLPEGVEPLKADLSEPSTLAALPSGLEYVFYTAGASAFTSTAYQAVYVQGVRNLLSALTNQDHDLKRVLFTSSTGVYAQQDGADVDEDSPTEPVGFSGSAVLEGERLFEQSPFQTVSLRLGGIYGPGRTALVDRVRKGEAQREKSERYLNLIHLEDIVGALIHLMILEDPEGIYIGVDSEPQEWSELLSWIACELRVPEPAIAQETASQRPTRNRRCNNARLRASGYIFKYPSCREGYAKLIAATGLSG